MPTPEPSEKSSHSTFWQLYLQEHRQPFNRWLHTIGTCISWIIVAYALWSRSFWLLLLAPVAGYLLAWSGHAFVEKNRPLSIRYPVRSLVADYRLTLMMIFGRNPDQRNSQACPDEDRL